ncbi:Uncharacterised protein [Mycobacteroides abscessus subsp. abscessus]|nr:Uncharacterised protein [Mycobacteroides abscessus subsp. abscessus]
MFEHVWLGWQPYISRIDDCLALVLACRRRVSPAVEQGTSILGHEPSEVNESDDLSAHTVGNLSGDH